jgi:glutamate synthase (NADPH/NADH) large chain
MAQLGIRSFDELVGRSDLLEAATGLSDKQSNLDLSPILRGHGNIPADKPHTVQDARNVPFDTAELAEQMVRDCLPAIENKRGGSFSYQVRNTDRSIGARLSGEIAKRHGNLGMESTPLEIALQGNVGQSFGVWNAGGLHLTLEGDANDYVGKGMAGGRLVLHPPKNAAYRSHETPIMGNTCLYGATGGELFAAGTAGERFGVRNSGATTVVEGVGDHGCEYMTGGIVAVLGSTGLNFGAAMTGGLAYVLDMEQAFVDRYNHELIDIHRLTPEPMQPYRDHLLSLIERHAALTGSAWSRKIANEFADFSGLFWLVKPKALELADLLATQTRAA